MKSFNFDIDSRLMQFLRFINGRSRGYYANRDHDICSFTRHMIYTIFVVGLFKLFILSIATIAAGGVIAVIGSLAFNTLMGWANNVYQVWWTPMYLVIGALIFTLALGVIISFFWVIHEANKCYHSWKYKKLREPEKEDSVLVEAYRSWKGKYCAKITFK